MDKSMDRFSPRSRVVMVTVTAMAMAMVGLAWHRFHCLRRYTITIMDAAGACSVVVTVCRYCKQIRLL